MFAPTEYLRWAMRLHGTAEYDLATSGMRPVPLTELGMPASLEDPVAWRTLRACIASYNGVPPEEAVPTLGTTHALWTAYSALLSPGDEVLVEQPTYEPMWRIAEGLGARVVRFARPPAERFALDPSRVAAAITDRTRLVVVSNLHNPGGVRAGDDTLREVAQIAAARGAHLLVDEVYAPFDDLASPEADDSGRASWAGSARRLGANVVVASSLTKGYGLGAHRIGWVLGPPDVASRAEDALVSNFGHVPLAYPSFAVHAFDRLAALAARARDDLRGKRDTVAAWVAARPDLEWSAPTSGLFGFVTVTRGAPDLDLRPLLERGARDHGVLVVPGVFFGVPRGFRLAWALDRARLPEALDRLGQVLAGA
jgi:aspartate/methionine/tyrosine aminotransferase